VLRNDCASQRRFDTPPAGIEAAFTGPSDEASRTVLDQPGRRVVTIGQCSNEHFTVLSSGGDSEANIRVMARGVSVIGDDQWRRVKSQDLVELAR
jgi:hypothetical protein